MAAAKAGTQVARSTLLPQLSLDGTAQHVERNSDFSRDNRDDSFGAALNLSQSLYSGGGKRAAVRAAKATLVETQAGADRTAVEITFQLRTAFVNLLHAQQQTELLTKIRDRRTGNSEMVELRYEGGLEHKGSLALIQALVYEAEVDLKQALREVGVARDVLLRVMGIRDGPTDLRVAGGIDELRVPDRVDMNELARRTPEYKRALASRQGAEEELKVARSGFLPSFDLESSAGRSGDAESFDNDRWSVGLKLTFPFWPGGKNVHEYGRAKANLAEAEAVLLGTENEVVAGLAQVQQDLRNASEDLLVQRALLGASETRAEISRVQYANGLLSFDNWDIIENDLITRSKLLLDAQRNALIAEAAWWRESGMSAFRSVRSSPGRPGASGRQKPK